MRYSISSNHFYPLSKVHTYASLDDAVRAAQSYRCKTASNGMSANSPCFQGSRTGVVEILRGDVEKVGSRDGWLGTHDAYINGEWVDREEVSVCIFQGNYDRFNYIHSTATEEEKGQITKTLESIGQYK